MNTKQKLEELGEMDTTKLMKYSICNKLINEKSDFIPILSNYSVYFSRIIKNSLTISGQISNKKIFIDNIYINKKLLNLKNIERKLIILYKEYGKKEYNRILINIELKENIKKIINELKNKKIEDIMNLKKYKMDIITSEIIQRERRKIEEEEKRREEYEKTRKEEEEKMKKENEKRRKEEEKRREEYEKRRKEEEEEKRRKEEEEKMKKEYEKRRKEEEEKRRKEEEEKMKINENKKINGKRKSKKKNKREKNKK